MESQKMVAEIGPVEVSSSIMFRKSGSMEY